jgi:D-amino-acid dehydrogenase
VETKTHGEIAADRVVVACGALTPFLNQQLGCRIPIQPGKGYSLTMPRPAVCPTYPLIFEQHRVAITPMKSGYRIGSTMEFAGYDSRINQRRLQLLRDSARLYLREPDAEPLQETWYGWRPMTWDSKPYIDRSPRFENVWVAAGHNMLGLSMATVTGKLIAEMMTGQQPHLDIRPLRIGR